MDVLIQYDSIKMTWTLMPVIMTLLQILAENLIDRLPMNLGKLQSLKVMILDGNRVTTLPDECNFLKIL